MRLSGGIGSGSGTGAVFQASTPLPFDQAATAHNALYWPNLTVAPCAGETKHSRRYASERLVILRPKTQEAFVLPPPRKT